MDGEVRGLVSAQIAADPRSNESTAAPGLLRMLSQKGTIVTCPIAVVWSAGKILHLPEVVRASVQGGLSPGRLSAVCVISVCR